MIVVHHLNNSRSQRVLWLLEELQLPYEIQRYERDPVTMLAPPSLRAVHPLGKSPVLTDDGLVIAESGAIIEYILDKYGAGKLRPAPGTPDWLRFTYWLHYAEGSAMLPLLLALIFNRLPKGPMPFFMRPIVSAIAAQVRKAFVNPQLQLHLHYIENELGRFPWFAGADFSAADIQMSFPLEAAAMRGDGEPRPNSKAFLERIHARPAYHRALQKGGPYVLMS